MNIEHISVSRDGIWHECKQKYKYKYHDKIPAEKEPIHFIYGKVVHRVIESYTRERGKKNINEIVNEALKEMTLPFDYRMKLPRHLSYFLKLMKIIGTEGEVEWHFNYDLDPPNKRELTGVIDLLVQHNKDCFIIDYKTTKQGWWRKTRESIIHDLQLQCYAWVIQQNYNIPAENIKTALYYLDGGDLISTCFTQKTLDQVPKYLLDVYLSIEKANPEQVVGTVGDHCRFCPYSSICPFYKGVK